jgi:ABC-type nickel/cobalt efflux system permease component RcnA
LSSADAVLPAVVLGLALGLRHAFEPDHVAAVCAMAAGKRGVRRAAWQGLCWGAGHTVVVGAAVLAASGPGWRLPDAAGPWLEGAVGLVLVALGAAAVLPVARGVRLHRHVHAHGPVVHEHLHAHRGGARPHEHRGAAPEHAHRHPVRDGRRPFLVGTLHGLAGSGALVLLLLADVPDPAARAGALAGFGVGLAVAMAAAGALLGLPLRAGRGRGTAADALRLTAGVVSCGVGCWLALRSAGVDPL